ncbi:uncharacterized protein Dwil_GK20955 [Drosophila willistoni]|uniref:Uncharacterized protein n=1 Tax=Drosophila willistoni TaxID=7260 RepID=A0A0Q9WNU1_DROWI|nr:uncharacterized protein Dwil_GK20955 [Drosophila willistoni]
MQWQTVAYLSIILGGVLVSCSPILNGDQTPDLVRKTRHIGGFGGGVITTVPVVSSYSTVQAVPSYGYGGAGLGGAGLGGAGLGGAGFGGAGGFVGGGIGFAKFKGIGFGGFFVVLASSEAIEEKEQTLGQLAEAGETDQTDATLSEENTRKVRQFYPPPPFFGPPPPPPPPFYGGYYGGGFGGFGGGYQRTRYVTRTRTRYRGGGFGGGFGGFYG